MPYTDWARHKRRGGDRQDLNQRKGDDAAEAERWGTQRELELRLKCLSFTNKKRERNMSTCWGIGITYT